MAYEDYVRLSKRDRRVERTVELSEADIQAVEQSRDLLHRRLIAYMLKLIDPEGFH